MNLLRLRTPNNIIYAFLEEDQYTHFVFMKLVECSELVKHSHEYADYAQVLKVFKNKVLIAYEPNMYSVEILKLMYEASLKLTGKKLPKSKA